MATFEALSGGIDNISASQPTPAANELWAKIETNGWVLYASDGSDWYKV